MKVYLTLVALVVLVLSLMIGYNIGQTSYHNYIRDSYYKACLREIDEMPVSQEKKEWMCYKAIYVGG